MPRTTTTRTAAEELGPPDKKNSSTASMQWTDGRSQSTFTLLDFGPRVFVVGGDSIGALQAVIAVLQVATVVSIMSEIEIRFAGSERLGGRRLGNVKPQKSFSSSPVGNSVIVRASWYRTYSMRKWRTDCLQGVALNFLTSGVSGTRGFLDQVDDSQRTDEQIVDIPVPGGSRHSRGGLHGFLPGQGSSASSSENRSSVEVFFSALFPGFKKVWRPAASAEMTPQVEISTLSAHQNGSCRSRRALQLVDAGGL